MLRSPERSWPIRHWNISTLESRLFIAGSAPLRKGAIMRSAALFSMSLLLIAGCAATTDSDAKIAGTNWRFTQIDGAPPVSEKAKISFKKNRLGASVGCNSMGGDWRVEDDRLIAGPLTQTEMYCAAPLWDQ